MLKFGKVLASALAVSVAATGAAVLASPAEAASVPTGFAFTGGGWGHGIGMSQVGAYGMASEGASATKILTHYYSGTTVGAVRDDQDIKVNLKHLATGVKVRTEALSSGGGAVTVDLGATEIDGKAGDTFGFGVLGTQVKVTKNGAPAGAAPSVVIRWSGTRYPSTTSADDAKASVLNLVSKGSSFSGAGHRYRYGKVKISARTASGITRLEAVNWLRLHDEYLRGLGEVPSSWPKAALQAQVIAGRSFALYKYNAGLKSSCKCHVYNGVSDQNFVGYSKESSSYGSAWRAAVAATNTSATTSQVVLYNGAVAQTFYSASTGGRTQNVKDVWGSTVPYLKSVDDHWSTLKKYNPAHATWGPYERSQKTVAAAFGLKNVARLDLSSRYVSGALKSATAYSSTGKKATLTVGTFVARLALTSNWVRTVTADGGSAAPAVAAGSGSVKLTKFPVPLTKSKHKQRYLGYKDAPHKVSDRRIVNGGIGSKKYSDDVLRLQKWLKATGYLKVAPNGFFGPSTHAAVKKFQKAHGKKRTGLVGGGKSRTAGLWKAIQLEYKTR